MTKTDDWKNNVQEYRDLFGLCCGINMFPFLNCRSSRQSISLLTGAGVARFIWSPKNILHVKKIKNVKSSISLVQTN